jgi:rhodanese-related sulfurtransferase
LSPTLTVSELRNQAAPCLLVDVRSTSEFSSGHIPGAVNIPMDQIETRLEDLSVHLPIVLTCQTGSERR